MIKSVKSLLLFAAFLICNGSILVEPSLSKPLRKYQVKGSLTIFEDREHASFLTTEGENKFCFGYNGMNDLKSDAHVTVADEQGKIIAMGKLEYGQADSYGCTMNFTVNNIPKASFYSIEVARRGKVTYSFDRMVETGWRVGLSIGDRY